MSVFRTTTRILLGLALAGAGIAHLTTARQEFQAQVPDWVPLDPDVTVVASGVAEIALGSALVLAPRSVRGCVGNLVAAFFVAVFPGNIEQALKRRSAFGLDTDRKRVVRLFFQPVLVAAALFSRPARTAK